MQLYALLESIDERVSNYNNVYVVCRSDLQYQEGYKIVENDFDYAEFLYQPQNKRQAFATFKPMLLKLIFKEDNVSDYCLFAVDDNIVMDDINLLESRNFLENNNDVYAFFYRLGKNIEKQDYTEIGYSGVPIMAKHKEDIFSWKFSDGKIDWNYPNNVDFTLYRKKHLKQDIPKLKFINPNHFEGSWSRKVPKARHGACYAHSRVVNIPMNRVNNTHPNRTIGNYSAKELNDLFLEGKKIDIYSIDSSLVRSVHQDMAFSFIERG